MGAERKVMMSKVLDVVQSQPMSNTMASDGLAAELMVGGERLTSDRRRELRMKLRAGELEELVFEAVTFRDVPNSNHTRFMAQDLPMFANSFVGVPFLRNHDLQDIASRDGTVIESRLVGGEFHQTIRLTTERGMKDFLGGVIDRFSIGWYFDGVECSVCGDDWMDCDHWPGQRYNATRLASGSDDGQVCSVIFLAPRGKETSAVNAPAVQGTRVLEQLCSLKSLSIEQTGELKVREIEMVAKQEDGAENAILLPDGAVKVVDQAGGQGMPPRAQLAQREGTSGDDDVRADVAALRAEIAATRIDEMIRASGLSDAGKAVVLLAAKGQSVDFVAQLIEAQRKADGEKVDMGLVRGIRPIVTEGMMTTPEDRMQGALNWIFGVREQEVPVPSLRNIREIYQAITGDHMWYGVFNPEWAQLAAATTTTLAGMVVNALNKVTRMHYDNMATYRWYERIVDVAPHDGSTHDVQMIMVDGLANLPTVNEGAVYTEATVGDSKESMSFNKHGHYVGITLETIRRSDIQRIQAIPRAMVQASIRTRSAAIAGLFTQNSGVGPTLADDATALFHSNHGNVATTAFGTAGWEAMRTAIWGQTIPGTNKPLGLWPTFVLVPIALYDDALTEFGYGNGDVGKPNSAGTAQTVNPYGESRLGDPRPVPIPVPDWSDATDWAAMVDPRLHPVIHMAYANEPQGGMHPLPEIFEVTSETSGLMFSNDTLPVKIRDWWSYGVSTYVGVAKRNVAG